MITFDKKQNLFTISNNEIMYVFFINELGQLQHLYYGKPTENIDIKKICDYGFDWPNHYLDYQAGVEKELTNTYVDRSLFEVPTSKYNDRRVKLVDILHSKVDFRYQNHEILKGKYSPSGLPHFKDEQQKGETLHVVLKDTHKKIYLHVYYSILEDYPVIFRNQTLENKDENLFLNKAHSFNLDIRQVDFDLIHFPGQWSHERNVCRERANRGIKKIASNTGRSSHEENPFIYLLDKDADEDNGNVYSFSLVYSGNFAFEIEVDKNTTTRISGGINEEDFLFEVKKNESFVFPEAILGYSNQGIGKISRKTHDLIRKHLIPNPNPELKETILLNSWEGCYLDFDTEKIISFINSAKEINTRLFILDDGWFTNRYTDDVSLGDWKIDEKKVDLKRIIDECHKCEMKFGLWFEPEMINPKSELFKANPEFAAVNLEDNPYLSRHQLPIDLCNQNAVENVLQKMYDILDNYEIDYVKWDHNRTLDAYYSHVLDENHQEEFYHRNILSFYQMCEKLTKRYPHILFHGCASGGGRFDLGTLYYYPELWTSDNTDPIDRLYIQYGTSMLYPLTTMGAHVSNKQTTSYLTKAHIALFGTYGFELDPNTLSKEEKQELLEVNEIFDKYHKEVISDGDLYRISSPFTSNYFLIDCVSKNKKKAISLFVNLKDMNSTRIIIKGLDENKKYTNTFDGKSYFGSQYEKEGIFVQKFLKKYSSLLIILEEDQ